MEVYAPFYGSVSSSPAINIPQHYMADGTNSQSKAKRGKKMKKFFRKMKKKSKKKKNDLTENVLHESVSRTSSYGSCSSSSSTDTSRTEETATSSLNASSHQHATYDDKKEEPAKRMSNENRKQDASSGENERRDEWKKQSKSPKRKDGQKVYPKRQWQDSSTQEETQRNRVGRIKGIWKKIRKPKKKNKIRDTGNLAQLYVECEDIKGVMTTNCEKLLKRNDKIEDLEDRGEKLVKQCEVFSRHAVQIKNEHASWWTRMRDALGRLCCRFCFCCRPEK